MREIEGGNYEKGYVSVSGRPDGGDTAHGVRPVRFNSLFPDDYFYINEPTQDNLKQPMADKYFLEDGQDIQDKIAEIGQDLVATPFKKGFLGDTISEIYKRYRVQRTSEYLDDLK